MTTGIWERRTTWLVALVAVVVSTVLAATTGSGATPAVHLAAAAPAVTSPSGDITVVHTPSGATGPCVPALLGLRRSVRSDADSFRLRIEVTAPLCSRINAVAVIYRMPGRGVAWPQTLQESLGFTWATTLVVPPDAAPGTWTVAARAEQCDTEVTVGLDVVDDDPPSRPPTTDGPEVAGVTEVAELPDDAVALGARADAAPNAAASGGGLAFTGSATHLPVAAGILLLATGGLLLLRSHRRRL